MERRSAKRSVEVRKLENKIELLQEIEDAIANIYYTSPYQNDNPTMISGMERVQYMVEAAFDEERIVEVVHAKWIKNEEMRRCNGHIYDYCCSCCRGFAGRGVYNNYDIQTPYCPHCGAKMDEK